MRKKHQKAASSMDPLRHCRRLSNDESLRVDSVHPHPHSAPVAGSFRFPSYPSPESPAPAASFAELVEGQAGLAEKLHRLQQEQKMASPEHPTSDHDPEMQQSDQAAMADGHDNKRATSPASDTHEKRQEEASEQDAGDRVTRDPPAPIEPPGYHNQLPPMLDSAILRPPQGYRPPNLPALQQATAPSYELPPLHFHHPHAAEYGRREIHGNRYAAYDIYQPGYYSSYQNVPRSRYGGGFGAYDWMPLAAPDPFHAAPRMIGSGSSEQQPFPPYSPVRPSANPGQVESYHATSSQYGAAHPSSSFSTQESSSSSCQGSYEIPTHNAFSGQDLVQTNHYNQRQSQPTYSYPQPGQGVPYGTFSHYGATFAAPPAMASYPPPPAAQSFGYGYVPEQLLRNPPGHATNYTHENLNPATATFGSSAPIQDMNTSRMPTRGNFETRSDEHDRPQSDRFPLTVAQELQHSRVRTRRRRRSPPRRRVSRKPAKSSRSTKQHVMSATSTPCTTPHTIDPTVHEMLERFQRRQPFIRQKKQPAAVVRGGWTTREEAFAIELMKIIKTPDYVGTIESLWHYISSAMQAEEMDRTPASVKNQWNRKLREVSGFDERARKKPHAMRTGINDYAGAKYRQTARRQAGRRQHEQEKVRQTESRQGYRASAETDERDDAASDEDIEQENESRNVAGALGRQPVPANGVWGTRSAIPSWTPAVMKSSSTATTRARGSYEEEFESSGSSDDMDEDQ